LKICDGIGIPLQQVRQPIHGRFKFLPEVRASSRGRVGWGFRRNCACIWGLRHRHGLSFDVRSAGHNHRRVFRRLFSRLSGPSHLNNGNRPGDLCGTRNVCCRSSSCDLNNGSVPGDLWSGIRDLCRGSGTCNFGCCSSSSNLNSGGPVDLLGGPCSVNSCK
jgi:hypothetical protein